MRAVYLPYALEKIVRALSYIAVLLLDIIHFILTPITWVKFKAHAFLAALAGICYAYLKFYAHNENALILAIVGFVGVALSILLIKLARKSIKRIRHSLIRIVYAPLGVCIYLPSTHVNKKYQNFNKLSKCGSFH